MRKRDELTDPKSCMNKASDEEMTFVLLGRDVAAPATIRFWMQERMRLGKNTPADEQIAEAGRCAKLMEIHKGTKVIVDTDTLYDVEGLAVSVQAGFIATVHSVGDDGWVEILTKTPALYGVDIQHLQKAEQVLER